ncbi:hypothetical protein ACEN4A_01495 [Latilactobacillus sakei]|uniref:Uncharacterized protein n=1 Tax=Latilactobacillus curvatus TaxID=28038 RepID=A0ABN6GF79_LATCU|nr:hypothetical protein [Latilactobacillus curvatus]BCX29488.1 hypothetical protein LTWDN19_00550 [Latilactobacillus curvatus]
MSVKVSLNVEGLNELIAEQKRAIKLSQELESSLAKVDELKKQIKIQVV